MIDEKERKFIENSKNNVFFPSLLMGSISGLLTLSFSTYLDINSYEKKGSLPSLMPPIFFTAFLIISILFILKKDLKFNYIFLPFGIYASWYLALRTPHLIPVIFHQVPFCNSYPFHSIFFGGAIGAFCVAIFLSILEPSFRNIKIIVSITVIGAILPLGSALDFYTFTHTSIVTSFGFDEKTIGHIAKFAGGFLLFVPWHSVIIATIAHYLSTD